MNLLLSLLTSCLSGQAFTAESNLENETSPKPVSTPETAFPLTISESRYNLCNEEADIELARSRQRNRTFAPNQWNTSFLKGFLNFSRRIQREVGIEVTSSDVELQIGYTGELKRTLETNLILKAPLSTDDTARTFAQFSDDDISALIEQARVKDQAVIATLIDSTCGGEMEIVQIAVDGTQIYVTNEDQEKQVRAVLGNADSNYQVTVNVDKINEIGLSQKISADVLTSLRSGTYKF